MNMNFEDSLRIAAECDLPLEFRLTPTINEEGRVEVDIDGEQFVVVENTFIPRLVVERATGPRTQYASPTGIQPPAGGRHV